MLGGAGNVLDGWEEEMRTSERAFLAFLLSSSALTSPIRSVMQIEQDPTSCGGCGELSLSHFSHPPQFRLMLASHSINREGCRLHIPPRSRFLLLPSRPV